MNHFESSDTKLAPPHPVDAARRRARLLAALITLLAMLAVTFSINRNTESDPRSTLLLSESLIQHGTVKLDHYGADVMAHYGETVHMKNGHYYSYFPIGTAIASMPFVAIANGWGLDMLTSHGVAQMGIATVTAALTLFFMMRLAGIFLPPLNAIVISGVFWFGTSFASTAGTALWSHNFAALFALIAIFLTVKATRSGMTRFWPLISICLFMAYLCRPTMALLSPFLLLFLFSYHRVIAIKTGALLAFFLMGLVVFSQMEWGQNLPDYYLPKRLSGDHFFLALYGNIFSPARGLLIYSPFILLAWCCYRNAIQTLSLKTSWLLIGLVWPVMHWIAVSRFPVWAAGWSYGPRFMTDVLPGLFLLTVCTWPVSLQGTKLQRLGLVVLGIGSVFAIYVNTWQGLFNPYTARWNMQPDIALHPENLFDWRYPQFLHNQQRHAERNREASTNLGYINLDFDKSWVRKDDAGMAAPYAMMSASPNARFTFSASTCFDLRMLQHGWSGTARVLRDGVAVREIDLYAPETNRTFSAFFNQDSKPHQYIVEVTGNNNAKSGGHEVWVDGVVLRDRCPAGE